MAYFSRPAVVRTDGEERPDIMTFRGSPKPADESSWLPPLAVGTLYAAARPSKGNARTGEKVATNPRATTAN